MPMAADAPDVTTVPGDGAKNSSPGPILCLLLGDDPGAAVLLKRRAEQSGRRIVLAATGYHLREGDAIDGAPVRAPMDYLKPADIDAIYRDLYDWQAGLLSQPLGDGVSLDAASSPPGYPPTGISWLPRFGAHLHLRLRFARVVRAMIAAERPSVICPVGRSETQPWAAALLGPIVAQANPAIVIAPPERLLPAQDAWTLALERDRRALDQERAWRAERRDAMRRLLRGYETRLQPLLDAADAPETESLEALIDAVAGSGQGSGPQTPIRDDGAALEQSVARLKERLGAAQTRIAYLTAARESQKLAMRRHADALTARLETACKRAQALESATRRHADALTARLAAARDRDLTQKAVTQRLSARPEAAQGRSGRKNAIPGVKRSVWFVLRRWFGTLRKGPGKKR